MKDQLVKHKVFIALAHLGFWPDFLATAWTIFSAVHGPQPKFGVYFFKKNLMRGDFDILSCGWKRKLIFLVGDWCLKNPFHDLSRCWCSPNFERDIPKYQKKSFLDYLCILYTSCTSYGCQPKYRGKNPKMDGENNGKPYEQMDDLGGETPLFFGLTPIYTSYILYPYDMLETPSLDITDVLRFRRMSRISQDPGNLSNLGSHPSKRNTTIGQPYYTFSVNIARDIPSTSPLSPKISSPLNPPNLITLATTELLEALPSNGPHWPPLAHASLGVKARATAAAVATWYMAEAKLATEWKCLGFFRTHSIHVWYICLHLP